MDLIPNPDPLPLPSDECDAVVVAFAALVRYQLTSVNRDGQPVAAAIGQCDAEAA
jgi:hypothetical protein